jgi:hypothetical protein
MGTAEVQILLMACFLESVLDSKLTSPSGFGTPETLSVMLPRR